MEENLARELTITGYKLIDKSSLLFKSLGWEINLTKIKRFTLNRLNNFEKPDVSF